MSVRSYLLDHSGNLRSSDSEENAIKRSLRNLEAKLTVYFGSKIVAQKTFGSHTRNTRLPGWADSKADVDHMVIFDNSENLKPEAFLARLRKFAADNYSQSEIRQSRPSVVLGLASCKFELLPAYEDFFDTYYIPASSTDFADWVSTDPDALKQNVDAKNKNNEYRIKPVIRLLKHVNARRNHPFSSMHIEERAISPFYFGCSNLKDYFYTAASSLDQWGITTSQRSMVDRLTTVIGEAKALEASGRSADAEAKIATLFG